MGIYKCPLEIGAKIDIDIVKSQVDSLKSIKKYILYVEIKINLKYIKV